MTPSSKKRRCLPPKFVMPETPCNIAVNRCPVPRAEASHRILIMRVGAFGDILMGTPLLAALRHAYPNAHLTWIVEHSQQQVINANPYIDEVIVWDGSYWKRMVRLGLYPVWLARGWAFRRELRARCYDTFVSFQPEEWPLLLLASGASMTIGIFDTFRRYYGCPPTSRRTRLYIHAYTYPNLPVHRIDQYLLTLDALGLPMPADRHTTLGFTTEDDAAASRFLAAQNIAPDACFVVLAPLTTWPSKCWPAARYAQLGDLLARRHHCAVMLIGAASEKAAVEGIAAQMHSTSHVAAGDLSFREMAALLARAQLVVSGDTGPMHAAAAVGTPFVALFGPTSAEWYGPQKARGAFVSHPVPCGPCDQKFCPNPGDDYLRCQKLITVDETLAAAEKWLVPALTL